MSDSISDGDETSTKRWEGYSDYRTVSSRITETIGDAIEAYAQIESLHAENARVRPEIAAHSRSKILEAALTLMPELEEQRETEEKYDEILKRWSEEGDGETGPFLEELRNVHLRDSCPSFLYEFVTDIRKAGWELGYLKAGRTVTENNLPEADKQAQEMFE